MRDVTRRALLATIAALPLSPAAATPLRIPTLRALRAGLDLEGTATAYRDAANGLAGMAVEVGALIADGLGVVLNLVPTSAARAVEDLRAGSFDLLLNAPPLTIEAAREVLFADPYAALDLAVIAPSRLPLSSAAALAGRRVAALGGRAMQLLASRAPIDRMEVQALPDLPAIAAALAEARVDAAIVTSPMASRIATLNPAMEVKLTLGTVWLAPACRFGDHNLLQAVNTLLYIARQEGRMQLLHQAYYERALPRPPFF